MRAGDDYKLDRWLALLDTPDCGCQYEWRSLGRLYGQDQGKGWVRMLTDPRCPHHAAQPTEGDDV